MIVFSVRHAPGRPSIRLVTVLSGLVRPGWNAARHHGPDIMLAATSGEAIARGDYQLVMGELHVGVNTLNPALFLAQHPSSGEVLKMMEADIPETRIIPIPPSNWPTSWASS